MRAGWPRAESGLRVGLLGGSFDPPHEGHAHITREALKRFRLDRVWWLVSPGNPLKPKGPAPLAERIAAAREVISHPRVTITGIERALGTRYTFQTLVRLRQLYPGVRFVWLMGADNLAGFHRWDRWERIMHQVPVGVLARPDARLRAMSSVTARRFASSRIAPESAGALVMQVPPAWCFVNLPMSDMSSTRLRARAARR